jgi:hypothetical protein
MPGKVVVSSWSDLLKKAKKDGESLGDAMKRLSVRWKTDIPAGEDPDYVLDATASPSTASGAKKIRKTKKHQGKKHKGKKHKGKKHKGKKGRKTRRHNKHSDDHSDSDSDDEGCPSVGDKGDVDAMAKAVRALMKSCGVCPRAVAKAVLKD